MEINFEKLLEELLLVPGVTGYEDKIRDKITGLIKDYLDQIETDAMGNLIGVKEGNGQGHLAFFAHMDEIGLVVANITGDGFIRFRKIGGIDDRILPSQHVKILTTQGKEIPGVIAFVPPHMTIEGQKNIDKAIPWQDLVIDIGASNDKEVKNMGIGIGDPVVFTKHISRLASGFMASRGMDNRAGCAVLIALIQGLKELPSGPKLSFVFTTQEEYGLRGAQVAGYNLHPDRAFIIDTASAPDFPGVPEIYKGQFKLGHGPLLRLVDVRMVAHQGLRRHVEEVASAHNIPLQLGVVGGSTDAASVQLAKGGIPTLPVCIPCRYTHATVETISLDDLKMTYNLFKGIIE